MVSVITNPKFVRVLFILALVGIVVMSKDSSCAHPGDTGWR